MGPMPAQTTKKSLFDYSITCGKCTLKCREPGTVCGKAKAPLRKMSKWSDLCALNIPNFIVNSTFVTILHSFKSIVLGQLLVNCEKLCKF